jgi:hypothetical protein
MDYLEFADKYIKREFVRGLLIHSYIFTTINSNNNFKKTILVSANMIDGFWGDEIPQVLELKRLVICTYIPFMYHDLYTKINKLNCKLYIVATTSLMSTSSRKRS